VDELLARAAPYLKILAADDSDPAALKTLGSMLYSGGALAAGRRSLARAAELYPGDPQARALFGNVLLDEDNFDGARTEFEAALAVDAAHAMAHRGLAILSARLGDAVAVRRHARALRDVPLPVDPCRGRGEPLRMLVLVSAIGGNIDLQGLIDDDIFERHTLIVELYDPSTALPQVDLVFNAIGDADRCADALDRAVQIVARIGATVVNHPLAVRATGRATNALRLSAIAGVLAPATLALSRQEALSSAAPQTLALRGISPPFLLRAAGFHTGKNVAKIERFEEMVAALEAMPGERFFAIAFIDTREDDAFVKYRVMFVGDEMLPLHCATSPNWNVHYYTAGMETSPERRDRDAAFLADMNGTLGPAAMHALEGTRDLLVLDYGGVDFGIGERGEVVVFEANATMVVPPATTDERFVYRNPSGHRVVTAIRELLAARARAARIEE
jgi:tetratricopeptide (TPR) repeat protein